MSVLTGLLLIWLLVPVLLAVGAAALIHRSQVKRDARLANEFIRFRSQNYPLIIQV